MRSNAQQDRIQLITKLQKTKTRNIPLQKNRKMKNLNIIITAAALLVLTMYNPCQAQEKQESSGFQFGVKGGVNFSTLYTSDAENSKMLAGFNVGIFSKLPVSGNFAFQPEFYFTTKGSDVTYNNAFVNGTARFKLDYLELPLLFVVNITDNFNIHAGPYAAYLLSGKVTNESNVTLFDFEDNIDVRDYNRFDAGLIAGVALDFKSVSFGARYSYGFVTVGKEKTFMGTTYTFPDANNGVINIYMAVPLHSN
jgi:hypothetical protein